MKLSRLYLRHTLFFSLCIIAAIIVAPRIDAADGFKLQPGAEGKICLKCHETFQKTIKSRSVHPLLKTGKCSDCHDPHTSTHKKLLVLEANELCFSCHKDVLPEKARSAHSIVTEGGCAKCHDSHASNNRFVLVKPSNELCFECHQDIGKKAKEARFKHDPMIKGQRCLNCHDPHASVKADHLLKKDVPAICAGCHKTSQASFKRKHMNFPVANSRCDACHSTHGSNSRGILYDEVHAPVAENKCNQCHLKPTSAQAVKLRKQGTELCRQCHQDMIAETLAKNRVHWPLMDEVGCLNCHNPHGSKKKKLMQASLSDTCGKCHADTVNLQKWSIENPKNKRLCEPVKSGNCIECHAPHGADNILLIPKASISKDLCGKCHEWLTHSSHPLGEKVVDSRNPNLTVECLSCHKACGTGNKPSMLPFETTYDLCVQCHVDLQRKNAELKKQK